MLIGYSLKFAGQHPKIKNSKWERPNEK